MELVDVTDSKSVDGNIVRVRLPPPAPARRKRYIACDEFFLSEQNSSCAYSAAPRPQTAAALPVCGFVCHRKNIGFNRPFQGNARRRQAASSESILLRYSTSEQTHFLFPFSDPHPPRLAIDAIPPGLHLRKYAVFCISVFSHALIFSALCYNG